MDVQLLAKRLRLSGVGLNKFHLCSDYTWRQKLIEVRCPLKAADAGTSDAAYSDT
jgi:hypothetical protein